MPSAIEKLDALMQLISPPLSDYRNPGWVRIRREPSGVLLVTCIDYDEDETTGHGSTIDLAVDELLERMVAKLDKKTAEIQQCVKNIEEAKATIEKSVKIVQELKNIRGESWRAS